MFTFYFLYIYKGNEVIKVAMKIEFNNVNNNILNLKTASSDTQENTETFAQNIANAVFSQAASGGLDTDATIDNSEIFAGDGDDNININANNSTINGGDGNNTMKVDGENNELILGNGDNNITNNADNTTLEFGDGNNTLISNGDSNNYTFGNGDNVITNNGNSNRYTIGDGNNSIDSISDNNCYTLGAGNNNVTLNGNKNSVQTGDGENVVAATGNQNGIYLGNGANTVTVHGENNAIGLGDGDNIVGMLGNNNYSFIGNGNNYFSIWGDNISIQAQPDKNADGNNRIGTLNYTTVSQLESLQKIWLSENTQTTTTEEITTIEDIEYSDEYENFKKSLSTQLNSKEYQLALSVDLTELVDNRPRYVITQTGDKKYHIYEYDSETNNYNALSSSVLKRYRSFSADDLVHDETKDAQDQDYAITTTKSVTQTTTTTTTVADNLAYDGINNINILLGDGNNQIYLDLINDADGNIVTGNGKNTIIVDNESCDSTTSNDTITSTQNVSERKIVLGYIPTLKTN